MTDGDASGNVGTVHAGSGGSVAALHPDRTPVRLAVAATTDAQFNTVQSALFPIACFKLEDVRFDFDSSLLLPDVASETPILKSLIDRLVAKGQAAGGRAGNPPLSIFGHTDPEGPDDYNKILGGRRAAVFYALLTRRTEIWEDLYSDTSKFAGVNLGDKWGTRSLQIMLNALPAGASAGPAPDPLVVDGQMGPNTEAAIRQFQTGHGLPASGTPDVGTRQALFAAYMDLLCVDVNGHPWQLDRAADFLAHNADPEGKGDFQGCGRVNPIMLFSQSDLQAYDAAADHAERDALNRQNRRVVALLFRPGATVSAPLWPCPAARRDMTDCIKRFWSDGDQRRRNGPEQREFRLTQDTFACRFYQRLNRASPCDGPRESLTEYPLSM